MSYARHYNESKKAKTATPAHHAIPGREKEMTPNHGGGYSFKLDKWGALRRFLIIGTIGGTYYATERASTKDAIKTLEACIKADGSRVIKEIVDVSHNGLAHKNDHAIFALAMVLATGSDADKKAVAEAYNQIVRTGTHHLMFVDYINDLRGWGRAVKRTVANWYNQQAPDRLSYQLAKYQKRGGWSHNDALRLCHARPATAEHGNLFAWATNKEVARPTGFAPIDGMYLAHAAQSEKDVIKVVQDYRLTREMIPTEYLSSIGVWDVLIENTPLTALIRNLGNLTRIGFLKSGKWNRVTEVCTKITDEEYIQRSRVHPISILYALETYRSGQGFRGKGQWTPVQAIVDALDEAFYKAFKNVEPTGKRYLLGLDVSGSMGGGWGWSNNSILTPAQIATAMAMVTYRTEQKTLVRGFSDRFVNLPIGKNESLGSTMKKIYNRTFGATNCSLPMEWALREDTEVDVFVVYTDCEFNTGRRHPIQALQEYRKASGIPAKMVTVGVTATNFTIADPKDAGMLDVVGFSADTPQAINAFVNEYV